MHLTVSRRPTFYYESDQSQRNPHRSNVLKTFVTQPSFTPTALSSYDDFQIPPARKKRHLYLNQMSTKYSRVKNTNLRSPRLAIRKVESETGCLAKSMRFYIRLDCMSTYLGSLPIQALIPQSSFSQPQSWHFRGFGLWKLFLAGIQLISCLFRTRSQRLAHASGLDAAAFTV